jgi:hypothetical protein
MLSSCGFQRNLVHRIAYAFALMISVFLLAGCVGSGGWLDHTGSADYDSVSWTFPDSPRNRTHYTRIYESQIQHEAEGGYLPPAYENWNDRWADIFAKLRGGSQENPEYYINYIKRRRAELDLPKD